MRGIIMKEIQLAFITSPMTTRWLRILTIIEKDNSFKLGELADRLSVSQRTLVKDISSIKAHFDNSINLYSNNNGYHFEEVNRILYQEKKDQLLETEPLFEIISHIFFGDVKTIDELAHHYNYSESTFRRFFIKIQSTFKTYNLKLSFVPVNIQGDEGSIRKFFFDFYYGSEHIPHTVRPPEGLHTAIIQELADELGNYEVGTGLSISAFYSLLYISIVRVEQGHFISMPQWARDLVYKEKDFRLLKLLLPIIKREYGIVLPEDELVWLHLSIVSNRPVIRIDKEILFLERFNRWPQIKPAVKNYLSNSTFDRWNRMSLETIFTAFLVSRKLNEEICETWNKNQVEEIALVKENYPRAYEGSQKFLKSHETILNFSNQYSEDIAVGLTIVSNLVIHCYQPEKNILFLLEGDPLIVQAIRFQARRLLENQYHLTFVSLHELSEEFLKSENTDLIVTNYRPYIFDYGLVEDYILVNTIPTEKDWEKVQDYLDPLSEQFSL